MCSSDLFPQGGATVQTSIVTPIIELLRNRMVTDKLGITVMAGLTGNVAIPRQTGAATGYWVNSADTSAITGASTQTVDQIALSPKVFGAYTEMTRTLLLQSSIDVENFVRSGALPLSPQPPSVDAERDVDQLQSRVSVESRSQKHRDIESVIRKTNGPVPDVLFGQ